MLSSCFDSMLRCVQWVARCETKGLTRVIFRKVLHIPARLSPECFAENYGGTGDMAFFCHRHLKEYGRLCYFCVNG